MTQRTIHTFWGDRHFPEEEFQKILSFKPSVFQRIVSCIFPIPKVELWKTCKWLELEEKRKNFV